ncbi:hypothetical protein DRW03_21240 [Corallococcus sp. H22C18031201]|nr:hypothetical protein DRW03_21240 [Corallococcus sp. H22C18031201]
MAEPTTMYGHKAYFTATVSTTLAAADLLDGIQEATVPMSADTVDMNYLGGDGFKSSVVTMRSYSINLTGHRIKTCVAQTLLRTHFLSGAVGYLTIIEEPGSPPGSQGLRFPVRVTSFEEGGVSTDVAKLSCTLVGQGAPVAV